ncbi:MAG: hypothetical protein L0H59_07490 [Tomitella sp.]|nr:hypothetical protein [Tomitella sp.]
MTQPPWSVRIGILAVAVVLITVATGGTVAAVTMRRRNAPPQPAERPPRVDDPLR